VLLPGSDDWSPIEAFRRELAPEASPVVPVTCGSSDDPGIGGPPAYPCDGTTTPTPDGSGDPPEPPVVAQRPSVAAPALVPGSGGAAGEPATAVFATTPTLVRAPHLQQVAVTRTRVSAFVDLPATLTVVIERQHGRAYKRVSLHRLAVKRGGTVRIPLPRLGRSRYRVTVTAAGVIGTASAAVRRILDLRPGQAHR
ncbi:MAG: hypothetical protein AAGC46_18710, partial [Solirubrobacteraceae bacterium]|nr:hypothetical protein [Patulibacter sp.]